MFSSTRLRAILWIACFFFTVYAGIHTYNIQQITETTKYFKQFVPGSNPGGSTKNNNMDRNVFNVYDIIHFHDYLLVVEDITDDTVLNDRDDCLFVNPEDPSDMAGFSSYSVHYCPRESFARYYKKVIGYLPLHNAKPLEKVALLPSLVVLDRVVNSVSEFNLPKKFAGGIFKQSIYNPRTNEVKQVEREWFGTYQYT
jgi:hypothetical protein